MRKVIGGNGLDNTVAAQAWLAATHDPMLRDLILIGDIEDPKSIWITNHEAPVYYSPLSADIGRVFETAVVTRGQVTAKIGLEVQSMAITLSEYQPVVTLDTSTANIAQLASQHFYDNATVKILRALMPTPGDADTIGCADWFGGRVSTVKIERNKITFNCKSFLDVVNQKVPSTVIEVTNTLASTAAVTIPEGDASVPVFQCFTGSSQTQILADCLSPTANKIYSGNKFAGGYMVFLSGPGATLAGAWTGIGANGSYTDGDGNKHSNFLVYNPLPWPPNPATDTFYVSMQAPVDLTDAGASSPFPYVPGPQAGV